MTHRKIVYKMQPSKKIRTYVKHENKRQKTIKIFQKAVDLAERGSSATHNTTPSLEMESGMMDMLSEDNVARIFDFVMQIDTGTSEIDYLHQAEKARVSAIQFALTCKRVASILRITATRQHAEILARGSTSIFPTDLEHMYPFTLQMKSEMVSCDQLKMGREAQKAMTCHCAKACCQKYQKGFNRDVRKGRIFKSELSIRTDVASVVPALESCHLLSASPCGEHAFAHVNRRLSKMGVHGEGRGKRFQDSLVKLTRSISSEGGRNKVSFTHMKQIDIEINDNSAPLTMRAAPNGFGVAYVCSEHVPTGETAEYPYSSAMLWVNGSDTIVKMEPPRNVFPAQFPYHSPALSAQDAWFVSPLEGCENPGVVVAWSTDFVHPSGHHVGSNGGDKGAAYLFATYTIEDGVSELFEHTDINESNQLITCSPTRSGEIALLLVRRKDTYMPGFRSTYLHNIRDDTSTMIPHNIPNSTKGPMCASISPTGDCVVSMHRTHKSLEVDVMVRTSQESWGFTPMQRIDVSPWLGLCPTIHEVPSTQWGLVKAKFSISFSPCGRFVAILDNHPFYGEKAKNNGVLTIDTALRMHKSRSLRPIPMFSTDDQHPRSFQWTKSGIWILPPGTDQNGSMGPRGGAICLHAPSKE